MMHLEAIKLRAEDRMTDFIITNTDTGVYETAVTLADAGRIRAELSEGRFAVAAANPGAGKPVETETLTAEPDATEFYSLVYFDQRSQAWRQTVEIALADSRAEAETKLYERLAYLPGREHGRDGWCDLSGDVQIRERFNEMVDDLMRNNEVDILRGYENDPRVARWLVEHEEV